MKHIINRLYDLLVAPRQHNEDIRNREIVLNVLLAGTLAICIMAILLLIAKMTLADEEFLVARVVTVSSLTLLVGVFYFMSRRGWHKTAATVLVSMYFLTASALVLLWGVYLPTAILLYSLVIVLAGILLGPRHSLYMLIITAVVLGIIVELGRRGMVTPDLSWADLTPGINDVAGYCFLFGIIALVTWLFNRQMARSLHKAERAEAALRRQKALLETTVEERTRELQSVQLEKIQQMYRFAELGQMSTAMMHDLANHLTSLTINVESLQGEKRSKVLADIKRSVNHIDEMVVRVRDQLQGRSKMRLFNVAAEIESMATMLRHRGHLVNVQLNLQLPSDRKTLECLGEPIHFRQMIANLITNGFDAYNERSDSSERREVLVAVSLDKSDIVITVSDWGRGIPKDECSRIFEPFHSTKKTGMGMGLYIVKRIVEDHFVGSVTIDDSQDHTVFVVRLPRADK